jgi:hypothetical protein
MSVLAVAGYALPDEEDEKERYQDHGQPVLSKQATHSCHGKQQALGVSLANARIGSIPAPDASELAGMLRDD